MFGKIVSIQGSKLILQNETKEIKPELMNSHVIFEQEEHKFVGEITFMDEEFIHLVLVGDIIGSDFVPGLNQKPSALAKARLIKTYELEILLGSVNKEEEQLVLGKSSIYPKYDVAVSLNQFFANHNAIIGNTGSGKSCGVSRILQNLFKREKLPVNAHLVLFDAYGEYVNVVEDLESTNIHVKKYSTHPTINEERLQFPICFLEADDLALLLSIESSNQIPVLEKTLELVKIFTSNSPRAIDYKNDIIAKCLLDIFSSGKTPSQCRDQVIAVLTNYHTETLNLDSLIKQPGYDRTFRQCLLIDEHGKINAIHEVIEFLQEYTKVDLKDDLFRIDASYTLEDLYYALEFALISEGNLNSDLAFEQNNMLKARLTNLINSENNKIFTSFNYDSKEQFVKEFFLNPIGDKVQLVNINLSFVDDRFAKILTKLYAKLFFNFTTQLKPRGSYSINIILEEAHRYVQRDKDIDIIGYNIFDRITKEGRKYGCLLTFITQRPSELSPTALSQCSNFLVFRLFHPKDLEIVRSISTNVTEETIERLKSINPGCAMVFGVGLKLPILIVMKLPEPMPESTSLNISDIWFEEDKNNSIYIY